MDPTVALLTLGTFLVLMALADLFVGDEMKCKQCKGRKVVPGYRVSASGYLRHVEETCQRCQGTGREPVKEAA